MENCFNTYSDHSFFSTSIFFYAFSPLIIILFLICLLLFKKNLRYDKLIIYASLVFISLYWGISSFNYRANTKSGKEKIIFWNVANNQDNSVDFVKSILEKEQPNIMCLVEYDGFSKEIENTLRKVDGYSCKQLKGEMFIIYKGSIDSVAYTKRDKKVKYNIIHLSKNSAAKKIILTDVYASPFVYKKGPLNNLFQTIKREKPNVILGDFNIPCNSTLLKKYKKEFNDFHHLGRGATSTWPYFFPIHELDMIWLDKRHLPISAKRKSNFLSDHKVLIMTFD